MVFSSSPDPASSMKEMGWHTFPKFWLADSASEEWSCDDRYIHDSGWGLELKRRLGQGNTAMIPKLLKALIWVMKEASTEKPSRGTNTAAINQPV